MYRMVKRPSSPSNCYNRKNLPSDSSSCSDCLVTEPDRSPATKAQDSYNTYLWYNYTSRASMVSSCNCLRRNSAEPHFSAGLRAVLKTSVDPWLPGTRVVVLVSILCAAVFPGPLLLLLGPLSWPASAPAVPAAAAVVPSLHGDVLLPVQK
jgi:hypothetical protein